MTMKRILFAAALFAALDAAAQLPAEIRIDKRSLRPRYREWAQPAGGTAVTQNPPALLWPAAGDSKRAVYRVRLSQDSTFAGVTPSEPFEWAAYACHEPLAEGRWYWQWSVTEPGGAERWSAVNAFTVDASCRRFATPTGEELVRRVTAMPHHRLYVSRDGADAFRTRAQRNPEAQELVRKARRNLNMDLVPVAPTRPRDTTGMTPFQKKSLINFMYHKFGEVVTQPVVDFSMAYLLTGEESYFIDALSDQLAATILDEAARAFNQITVYGRDSEAGQVINLCRQMPMMGQYQVVILKEAQQLKGLDKLVLYTQKPSPTTILVICHKEKNADKRSAFYKGCAANGTVLESVRPRDYEIAAWLQQFIRQKGFTIDPKALSMLTDHLGTDIAKISNEIRKLTVSLPEGTQRITDADIEANIGISKDFNNFELCKAVVTRDMARALMIAEHFARNPKDNPLLLTVMALFGQFKELFVVNYLRWLARHKGRPFPPDTELMRILRKNNTFVIGEIKQNAAGWDNRKVFNILGLLREYDAKSKGLGAGGASDGELLRELLLKIFLL